MCFQNYLQRVLPAFQQLLLSASILSLTSCGGGGGGGDPQPDPDPDNGPGSGFDQGQIVSNVSTIMRTGFTRLGQSSAALESRIDQYCGALGTAGEQSGRDSAQAAFKTAMNDLQHTLLYNIGPAKSQDRLAQIYSWPLTSACQIDRKLANNLPQLNNAVDKRGLDALEYLLFVDPAANDSCPANFQPVPADLLDNFNALSAAEKQTRRCAFMQPVAEDIANIAKILADAWDENGGNYGATLTAASNTGETLNLVTDAMFYFEEVLKENKLDAPLGGGVTNTAPSCGLGQVCPQDVESPHAQISKENLRANVLAFQGLYLGGAADNAAGFDDWLKAEGETALAESFAADIQAVLDGLDGINGSLFAALSNDVAKINALMAGPIQDVSRPLRANVLQALGLRLPLGSESDTD